MKISHMVKHLVDDTKLNLILKNAGNEGFELVTAHREDDRTWTLFFKEARDDFGGE